MPATGILSKEHSQEECEASSVSTDSVHGSAGSLPTHAFDNNRTEVSLTSVDSDQTAAAATQSSCMDVSSGFVLDGSPEPKCSIPVTLSKINKGFQNTFSALTSGSCGDGEDKTGMDVSTGANVTEQTAVDELQDSRQTPTAISSFEYEAGSEQIEQAVSTDVPAADESHDVLNLNSDVDMQLGVEHGQVADLGDQRVCTEPVASDCVYFIQGTDASGQVVTSIIDPNDISLYADSVIYKQCLNSDGEIETTVVHSGSSQTTQNHTQEETDTQQQSEQQVIYAHDPSGQLIPLDPDQYINDVPPPGKQFVYMQDASGRIIRTVMDASQNMVPGQQVYYTQSDDGQMITSVMDSCTAAAAATPGDIGGEQQQLSLAGKQVQEERGDDVIVAEHQPMNDEGISDHRPVSSMDGTHYQQQVNDAGLNDQQLSGVGISDRHQIASQQRFDRVDTQTQVLDRGASFSIDNTMSGLSMLAELSHLTSGQGVVPGMVEEQKLVPDGHTSVDVDGFRPVAKMTEQAPSCSEGLESVSSDIAELKVTETDSDSLDPGCLSQTDGAGHSESLLARIVSQLSRVSPSVCRDNLFIQWQNLDAMCWMDVILIMLVHSPSLRPLSDLDPGHELASTLLVTLLKANRQAQILLQNLLKKHNGAVISDPDAGPPVQDPKTSKIVCKENMDEIGKAINVLYAMREKIWQALQPRLRCERGKHNSPVLVLPLLVRQNPTIKQMFTMRYRYVFKCDKCSYTQDDSHSKILPSIPAVPEDFNMTTPCFVRSCFECQAPNQRMMMKFEQLQDFVQMHFVKGLPHSRFDELSFDFNNDHYEVTAFVHYKNNPDHFIAWVRNSPGTMWMECDDLKSVITRYTHTPPNIPPSQVHMVLWERRLTPQHTLVMRDTEDTKLLASLVLTVQQPNTHHQADTDARSSSGTAASSATSQSSTSLLSGLMTQSLAQRGRGLGSNGVRAGASAVSSMRQINPVATQLSNLGNPQPRVIRLPLSALANSGLSLRGGPGGSARYVLVGNNSQGGTLSQAGMSNTVVVRTPGGTTSMSATQLLQLLQQSGGVGQIGTRLTATMSSSGANAKSVTTFVQQDGNITSTASSTDISGSSALTEQSQAYASPHGLVSSMETADANIQNNYENASSAVASPTISTLPFITSGRTINPDTTTKSLELETSNPLSSQGSNESAISVNEVAGARSDLGGQVVKSQSQQPRYLKVTHPSGGTFLCQLAMKNGKMVLVPVDKAAQAGSSDTSTPKQLSTPGSSQQEAAAVPSGNVLAQIHKQMLQGSNQGPASGARLVSIPGKQGSQIMQISAGPSTQTDQPTPKADAFNSAGRHPTSGETLAKIDGELKNVPLSSGSLLKAASARQTPHSSSLQQQVQETYRYVHPGSNTTHVLHTGTSETQGTVGQSGHTLAALSSGAAVDGQPTFTSSAAGVSSGDPELTSNNSSDSQSAILTPKQRLSKEMDTTEYIPLGPGRIHGAHRRGRGRGGRGRGRGRGTSRTSETDLQVPSAVSSHISTFSDLKQIGAHIIRAESEAIDGVPVVSIPDFSTEIDAQTIMPENHADPASTDTHTGSVTAHSQDGLSDRHSASSLLGSQVFAQQSPRVTNSHNFNVSAQGIQGSPDRARQHPSALIHARSLLTGKTTTLRSPSFLSSLPETTASSQASSSPEATSGLHLDDAGVDTDAQIDPAAEDSTVNVIDGVLENEISQIETDQNDTVMSVEENQTTAERYRMPTELFQPEEESPEKSVKIDETDSRVSGSLSPRVSQEVEMRSLDDTEAVTQKSNTNAAFCSPQRETEVENTVMEPESLENIDSIISGLDNTSSSVDGMHTVQTTSSKSSKVRKGRSRAGNSKYKIHESDIEPKAVHQIVASSSDSSTFNDKTVNTLQESNLAGVSSPEKEPFLHLSNTDSAAQPVTADGDRLAVEPEDVIEDGLRGGSSLDAEEGHHSSVRRSRKTGSARRSNTGGRKRGGRKNSRAKQVPDAESDAVQDAEPEPVVDSGTAEPAVDSSCVTAEGELKSQDVTDVQHGGPTPLLEDYQPDELVNLVKDGYPDRPVSLVEDGRCDKILDLVEGHHDGSSPLEDGPLPLEDGPKSLVEDGQCNEPEPLVERGLCDRRVPLTEDDHNERHVPLPEDDHHERHVPLAEDDHNERPVPLAEDDHHERPVPLAEDDHHERPVLLAEDDQCVESLDLVEGHHDELLPLNDEPKPLVEDGYSARPIPLAEDIHCDGLEGSSDEPIPGSAIPSKKKRSRGRSRLGRTKRGKKGKSGKPSVAKSQEIINTGTDSSLVTEPTASSPGNTGSVASRLRNTEPTASSPGNTGSIASRLRNTEPTASSSENTVSIASRLRNTESTARKPGNTLNGTPTHLCSPENTPVQPSGPSEVLAAQKLVMGSAEELDSAVKLQSDSTMEQKPESASEQQFSEDLDHMSSGNCLEVVSSKEMLKADVREQKSCQPLDKRSGDTESVIQHQLKTVVESDCDITSGTPSEGFTHITSPDIGLMHSKGKGDSSGECRTLAVSSSGFTTDGLHTEDSSTQLNTEGVTETPRETLEIEAEKSSKSVGKSRGRAKGRSRKQSKKKADVTVVPEAEERCGSGTGSVKETAAVDPSVQQSPSADPSQLNEILSSSPVETFSDPLSGAGPEGKPEQQPEIGHVETKENEDKMTVAESLTSETPSRTRRSKGLASKRRGKRKLDDEVERLPETSNKLATVSSPIQTANLKSMLHSNENLSSTPKQVEHKKKDASKVAKKKQKKAKVEKKGKEEAESSTAPCYKRRKVDWGVTAALGNTADKRASFSYRVFSDKCAVSKTRHSSLDRKPESFVSPGYRRPSNRSSVGSCTSDSPSPAVVKRLRPKPQQRPEIDSSPDAIPLSINKQLYPGYSGGSVVRDGKEVFTGVVLKRRQSRADWGYSNDSGKALDLSRDRFHTVPVTYCKRLISSLCINSGGFSAAARAADIGQKKSVGSDYEEANSVDMNMGELESLCSSAVVEPAEGCNDALAESGQTCKDKVDESITFFDCEVKEMGTSCDVEVKKTENTFDDEVKEIGTIFDGATYESGKPCDIVVKEKEKACDGKEEKIGKTCHSEVSESEKPCDNEMKGIEQYCDSDVKEIKLFNSDVASSEKPCYDDVANSGKACADDLTVSQAAGDNCAVMTDVSDQCAEAQPDLAVCASDVFVNKSAKSSRKTRGKHKRQRDPSSGSTHPAKRAKASVTDSCPEKMDDPSSHTEATAVTVTHTEAVGNMPPASTSPVCSSPTRRSGRTPIPSKKILDALEYLKMPSALKMGRSGSSDGKQADSGSDGNI